MSDNAIEIRITGAVDSSLASAVSEAKAITGTLSNQAAVTTSAVSDSLKALAGDVGKITLAMQGLGRATAAAGAQVASDLNASRAATRGLSSAAATMGTEVVSGLKTAEDATHGLHLATVGAIEDYVRLGQQAASGNLSGMASTLLSLGKETGVFDAALATMGTEAAIATGGVAVLAGGLGYLAYQAAAAQEAVQNISLNAAFAGNDISTKELDAYIGDLDKAADVSQGDAEKIAAAFLRIKGMTKEGAEAAGREVDAYAKLTGQSLDDATKALVKAFSDPVANVRQFVASLHGVSVEQVVNAEAAATAQDRYGALTVMIKALNSAEVAHRRGLIEQNSEVTASLSNMITYSVNAQNASASQVLFGSKTADAARKLNEQNWLLAGSTAEFDKNAAAINAATEALRKFQETPQGKVELGTEAADKEDPLPGRLANAKKNVDKISAAITVLNEQWEKGGPDTLIAKSDQLDRQLHVAQQTAQKLQGDLAVQDNAPNLDLWKKQQEVRTAAAKLGSTQRAQIAHEEMTKIADALQGSGVKPENYGPYLDAEKKYNEAVVAAKTQSVKAASSAEKIGAEESISAARDASQEILANDHLTASERGALAKQVWDLLSNGDKLNTDQRAQAAKALAQRIAREEGLSADQQKDVEAQISSILVGSAQLTAQQRGDAIRDGARAESEARRQAAREAEQIEKDAAQNKIDAAKNAFEETSTLLEAEAAQFGLTESEKIAAVRAATDTELDAQIKVLTEQQKHYREGVDAYRDYQKKIDDLREQQRLKALQYDTEEAKAAVKIWQSIISPIESGMSSMVSSLIGGQTKFGAATRQLLVQVVSDWVSAGIKIEFDWLAGRLAMELGDQKWAQKSILEAIFGANTEVAVHKQAEAEKTATTAAGTATRDALGETENSGFLGRIVDQIAQWLGLETSKTAETATGTAARITASGAETAATIAAAKAQAAGEIPAYTGIAAMEAASAVADIPIIGPGLALAAAEAMNTQGATELSIATAEGGMESVDAAEQAVLVHRKESILPARISVPLMSFVGDLPAIAERVKQNSTPDLRSIADVGSLLPVMSPSASVRAAQRPQAPQSDADYVASRVGGGGRASASPPPVPSKARGGDIHIHAWDASSMNQFFRKPSNRRTMDQISKDRVRAGFLPG